MAKVEAEADELTGRATSDWFKTAHAEALTEGKIVAAGAGGTTIFALAHSLYLSLSRLERQNYWEPSSISNRKRFRRSNSGVDSCGSQKEDVAGSRSHSSSRALFTLFLIAPYTLIPFQFQILQCVCMSKIAPTDADMAKRTAESQISEEGHVSHKRKSVEKRNDSKLAEKRC